jgi:hypothetical protein
LISQSGVSSNLPVGSSKGIDTILNEVCQGKVVLFCRSVHAPEPWLADEGKGRRDLDHSTDWEGTQTGGFASEPTAAQILDGAYVRKPSPSMELRYSDRGFAWSRLSKVPPPGIHPRVLLSPDDLPDIRRRSEETSIGRSLLANLRRRVGRSIGTEGTVEARVFALLAEGQTEAADLLLSGMRFSYQPGFLYPLMLDCFDCLLRGDVDRGKEVARVVTGFATRLERIVDDIRSRRHAHNASRSGSWHALGSYGIIGFQYLGHCYDFAYGFMDDEQRKAVRRVISKATFGRISHGMELPNHWRYWNWMNCGNCFGLLALAIEGEDGYDERVYRRSVEVMQDYLTYGISRLGSSTESVGYTAFGFVWGVEAMIAMARRGDNLFLHPHFRAMKYWHLHTMQPYGQAWQSHGDGGNGGPGVHFAQMMKYYYPDDEIVDYLWQNAIREGGRDQLDGDVYLIPTIICADDGHRADDGSPVDHRFGAGLGQSLTFFDPERGSLITRDGWSQDAVVLQFECRTDTVSCSHEHADRGAFTLSALGRIWALDGGHRAPETKYHNSVLIDGKGQGFFAPPGKWLGLYESSQATFGVCDAKNAYDWFWPKTIVATTRLGDPRLDSERWASAKDDKNLGDEVRKFQAIYGHREIEKDPTPSVKAFYEGYLDGDPRIWDEDTWPVRIAYNPVSRAFRTVGIVRGMHTYCLVIDDIEKDDREHLYEWVMMVGMDTELVSISGNDLVLGAGRGVQEGDPLLLVRIIHTSDPADRTEYCTRPSARLETLEKMDTTPLAKGLSGGMDRRLVIGSRSKSPDFKIMLFPYRHGQPIPETIWSEDRRRLRIRWPDQDDLYEFGGASDGRTRFSMMRAGAPVIKVK